MVQRNQTRWPQYIVKTLENLLQNQESFGAESWDKLQGLKLSQACSNDDHRLTFDLFTARSHLRLYRFVWGGGGGGVGGKLKNHFFQYVFKTNG